MTKVLFVGESWSVTSTHTKGFDSFTTTDYAEGGAALLRAIDTDGVDVTYMPCHVAARSFPMTRGELDAFDVVLFSDIGSNTLLLPPRTFLEGVRTPNRLNLIKEWVSDGGGFGMIGGYMSFQGIEGKANYGRTVLAEILPVEMLVGDDRIETPEGSVATAVEHPIVSGVEAEWPPLLGYQRLIPRPGASVIARFEHDPLLVVDEYGAGRVLAYASDIGPHWAPEQFTDWSGFRTVWQQAVTWLAGTDRLP